MYQPPRTDRGYRKVVPITDGPYKLSGMVIAERVKERTEEIKRNKSRFAKLLKIMRSGARKTRLRKRFENPSDMEGIERMTEEFHGRPPREDVTLTETIEYEDRLAILADLLELSFLSQTGKSIINVEFNKKKERPKVTTDSEGDNIEFHGGDQRLNFRNPENKEQIVIGHCVMIAYETDKHHLEGSNGVMEGYEHYFGEEWYKERGYTGDKFFEKALEDGVVSKAARCGLLPMGVYDTRNERILLVGGKYKIEDVGIRN